MQDDDDNEDFADEPTQPGHRMPEQSLNWLFDVTDVVFEDIAD